MGSDINADNQAAYGRLFVSSGMAAGPWVVMIMESRTAHHRADTALLMVLRTILERHPLSLAPAWQLLLSHKTCGPKLGLNICNPHHL